RWGSDNCANVSIHVHNRPAVSLPNRNASPLVAVHARILGDASVRLWGLSPRARLVRLLTRTRVAHVGDATEPVPGGCSMVLIRGDYVYDDRVVTALVRTPNVLLRVTADDGPAIVAAHVPADLAAHALEVMNGAASPHLPGVLLTEPASLASSSQVQLRKLERPFVRRAPPA